MLHTYINNFPLSSDSATCLASESSPIMARDRPVWQRWAWAAAWMVTSVSSLANFARRSGRRRHDAEEGRLAGWQSGLGARDVPLLGPTSPKREWWRRRTPSYVSTRPRMPRFALTTRAREGRVRVGSTDHLKFGAEVKIAYGAYTSVKVMAMITCLTISTSSRGGLKINVSRYLIKLDFMTLEYPPLKSGSWAPVWKRKAL